MKYLVRSHLPRVDGRQAHGNARERDHYAEADEQERNEAEPGADNLRSDEGLREHQRVHMVAFELAKFCC